MAASYFQRAQDRVTVAATRRAGIATKQVPPQPKTPPDGKKLSTSAKKQGKKSMMARIAASFFKGAEKRATYGAKRRRGL